MSLMLFASMSALMFAQDAPVLVVNSAAPSQTLFRSRYLSNGQELVTISRDKTIRVWDLADPNRPPRILRYPIGQGLIGQPYGLDVSRDDRYVAVAGNFLKELGGGQVYLLSLQTGEVLRALVGHKAIVFNVAFSPDGKYLATACEDKTSKVFDVETGQEVAHLAGHADIVYDVVFSPDSKYLATASLDRTARIWNISTSTATVELRGHQDKIRSIDWCPNCKLLATGSWDKTVRIWRPDGTCIQTINNEEHPAYAVRFTSGGKQVACGAGALEFIDRQPLPTACRWFDINTGSLVARSEWSTNELTDVTVSPDGQQVAVAGTVDGSVRIFDSQGNKLRTMIPSSPSIKVAAWGRDGQSVYWGTKYGPELGLVHNRPLEFNFNLLNLRLSRKEIAATQTDEVLRNDPQRPASHARLVPGGLALLSGNGEFRFPLKHEQIRTAAPGVSADERMMVFGTNLSGWVISLADARVMQQLEGHAGSIIDAVFAGNPNFILTASDDRTVSIWKIGRTKPLLSIYALEHEWIAWTPEGYYASTPGGEKLIGWQLNNGPDKTPSFHPAERYHDKFYRPDLIKRIMQFGDLDTAFHTANKISGRGSERKQDIAQIRPPKVEWLNEPVPDQLGRVKVHARATSGSGKGIKRLTLMVDGSPYHGTKGEKPKAGTNPVEEAIWSDVRLTQNKPHELKVFAFDAENNQGESLVKSAEFMAETSEESSRLFVVAVGVSQYRDTNVKQLHFCQKAASLLSSTLTDHSKPSPYRSVELKLLENQQATKAGILDAVKAMGDRSTDDDVFVLYLAGHGEEYGSEVKDKWAFCPYDYQLGKYDETCLTTNAIVDILKRAKASRRAVILDACYSGTAERLLADEEAGIDYLCSSQPGQTSQESNESELPNFTRSLIKRLKDAELVSANLMTKKRGIDFYKIGRRVFEDVLEETGEQQRPIIPRVDRPQLFISDPTAK